MKILRFLQRGYRLHLMVLLVLAGEVGVARWAHKTDADIDAMVATGSPREKAHGLYVKASRGELRFTRQDVVPMLRSDEPLVRELMMTPSLMRFPGERIRKREMDRWPNDASWLRSAFLLRYRIGNYTAITLEELKAFLEADAGDS